MALLEMRDIYKSFNGITVLNGVNLTVEKGTVHALLGENGAGKSTLMNVLTGVHNSDGGSITFDGEKFEHMSIKQTESKGISFVHQELNLFNDLKVYENIFLGKELTNKAGILKKKEMIEQTKQLFEKLGVDINPTSLVADLRTSEKQLLEISKALFFDAKLLILDEPTTSLTNDDVAHLFKIVNKLKENGTAFIFISHKMPEVFELADNYTVFRNGHYICEGAIKDTNPDEITSAMVGEKYSNVDIYEPRTVGGTILKLNNLSGDGFMNINMDIKQGQVIGVTGLQGSGSSELMQCIFGATPILSGSMEVNGKPVKNHSIHKAMKLKIGMLAANRKENSVLPDMSIRENMNISEFTLSSNKPVVSAKNEEKKYQALKKELNIKAQSSDDPIISLSGGNQQKVFIARWLNTKANLLLFDNPTQGIDVGAKAEIYKLILKLANEGNTIVINTLEIPELQKVADYCAVFYEGEIVKILQHNEIEEQTVMKYSTGAGKED
jgi:ribose transport system ATP-binding protein